MTTRASVGRWTRNHLNFQSFYKGQIGTGVLYAFLRCPLRLIGKRAGDGRSTAEIAAQVGLLTRATQHALLCDSSARQRGNFFPLDIDYAS